MYSITLATFGKKTLKSHDWFETNSTVLTPTIESKRAALIKYKRSPSKKNLQIVRDARSKIQKTARRCANECWAELSETTQTAAATGNIRVMYDGIKKYQEGTEPSSNQDYTCTCPSQFI